MLGERKSKDGEIMKKQKGERGGGSKGKDGQN